MSRYRRVRVRPLSGVLALWLLTAFSTLAFAQGGPGALGGRVIDSTEAVLPGATVRVVRSDAARDHTVVTDGAGRFLVSQLPTGSYVVTVTLSGFRTETLAEVKVTAGDPVTLTVTLTVSTEQSVEVRGTARNYASSIAGKRMADGVTDMFNTDELGRMPDKNIGETLNRIPGVSMLLEKGEGRFVQIRGISPRLNNVTINGLALGNSETESGGRLVPLDVIGGELLAGVQVMKTPTSDMDGQGIGGTLNLTTKQPFDFPKNFTALFSSRSGIETVSPISPADTKEMPYVLDVTLAGKIAGGKVGWLAGASFSNRYTPLPGIFNDNWRTVKLGNNSINYPTNVKNNVTVTGRERLNLNGSLEFRPSATTKFYVRSFVAHWDELQLRNRFDEGLGDVLTAITSPTSGTIASNRVQVNLRNEVTAKRLQTITAGGGHQIGAWGLDYVVQRHDNSVDEPNDNWEFRSGASTFGPDTFSIDEHGAVTITSPGRDRKDAALQGFRRVRFFKQLTEETGHIAAVDLRRSVVLGRNAAGFFKVGGKFTQTRRETAVAQDTYNIGTLNWNAAQVSTLTRGGFTNPVPLRDVPNIWLDLDGLTSFFAANRADTRFFRLDPAAQYLDEYQSDFTIRERVTAAYGMGKVDFGRVSVTAGVRVEQTDLTSSAFAMVTRAGQLVARPIEGSGKYTDVLPSAIATFTLRHDLLLRTAFSRSVGRPEFDAVAPRSRLSIEDNPTLGTIGTLTIGNPDLQARVSNNFDGSVEWYFAEGSLASAAVFRKNISNEIIPAPTVRQVNYTFLGQTFDRFDTNTTVNAENADVTGIELTFAHRLSFLPGALNGLGIGGHATFIRSGVDVARGTEVLRLPLLQQADQSRSFTLYYQKGRWDVSGTYKYNSNFLTDYGDSRALDLDQGSFGRFDVRAQFDLTRDLKFTFTGINLNNEPTTEFQGGIKTQITEYEYTGRTFFFGLSMRISR